jgi:hypothetical protein
VVAARHTRYDSHPQVFLYKRAQIFVGDVFGALRGGEGVSGGLGAFHDIHHLTMFADYRVRVIIIIVITLPAQASQWGTRAGFSSCDVITFHSSAAVACLCVHARVRVCLGGEGRDGVIACVYQCIWLFCSIACFNLISSLPRRQAVLVSVSFVRVPLECIVSGLHLHSHCLCERALGVLLV